jgi:hypothetical protein
MKQTGTPLPSRGGGVFVSAPHYPDAYGAKPLAFHPVSDARRFLAAAAYCPRGRTSCTCGRTTVS